MRIPIGAALGVFLALVGTTPCVAEENRTVDAELPNIVLMVADDQGWAGTSVAMHPKVEASRDRIVRTPHLERLAKEGMRFSAAYAPSPVCAPTRIALQTGRSPAALHWTRVARSVPPDPSMRTIPPESVRELRSSETTIGELLRAAGYRTAHFGKWHINGGGPGKHGYDVHDGDLGNEAAARFTDPNPVDIFGMTERAVEFMKESRDAKKPFYVQLSWHALHSPDNARKATIESVRERGGSGRRLTRTALAEDLDAGVGVLLDALADLDLAKTTYVIYTSDNGSGGGRRNARRARQSTGLSGGKGNLGEGGLRVPFVIRGPGVAADSWSHVPITGLDFLPTFAEWAGVVELPAKTEGGSFATVVASKGEGVVSRPREELCFHFPHYQTDAGPHSAILLGTYKLVKSYEQESVTLFDLSRDIGEQNDLSAEDPERAAAMEKRLDAYLKEIGAALPRPNPDYDPDAPKKERRRGGRRKK